MSPDYRWEYDSIQRGMTERTLGPDKFGMTVYWYVWDDVESKDPVYEEAGRSWKDPVELPVYHATRVPGPETDRDEGLFQVEGLSVIVVPRVWQQRGLPDINDPDRVKDRVMFETKTYSVDRVIPAGRFGPYISVYRVDASQVLDDERSWDA